MSKKDKIPQLRKPFLQRFPFNWFPFTLLRKLILFGIDLYHMGRRAVEKSIRLQLVLTFAICLVASSIAYEISSNLFGQINKGTKIDYSMGVNQIDNDARELVRDLEPVTDDDVNDVNQYNGNYNVPDAVNGSSNSNAGSSVTPGTGAGTGAGAGAGTAGGSQAAPQTSAEAPGASGQIPGAPPVPATPPVAGTLPGTVTAQPIPPLPSRSADSEQQKKEIEQQRMRDFGTRVKQLSAGENYKILITDLEGKVVYRTDNAPENHVDVHSVIRNAMDARNNQDDSRKEFSSFYPVTYKGQKSYLIVSGIPQPYVQSIKGESPISSLVRLASFIILFYYLTRKKMRYIEELASGLRIIATGNLDYRVIVRSDDELGSLAKDMNLMVGELHHRIEEERRSERLKNELITNVSHDLRTPLTLIMGYLRLLHDKNYETPEQAAGYLSIAYNKSEKLKVLIDDLFEYTKLTNKEVPLQRKGVAINDLLDQLVEEYVTIGEEQKVTVIRSIPHEKLMVQIDVDQMIRVFENLLGNAIKYSPKPGIVTVGLLRERSHALVRVANKAENLTPEELSQLFDRFYRVDSARSSDTGGSGLGLAISKSIVESHGGKIWAEQLNGDIILYVELKLEG